MAFSIHKECQIILDYRMCELFPSAKCISSIKVEAEKSLCSRSQVPCFASFHFVWLPCIAHHYLNIWAQPFTKAKLYIKDLCFLCILSLRETAWWIYYETTLGPLYVSGRALTSGTSGCWFDPYSYRVGFMVDKHRMHGFSRFSTFFIQPA